MHLYGNRLKSVLFNRCRYNYLFRFGAAVLSLFIVAFGQSAWAGFLGPPAAVGGYAIFWWAIQRVDAKRSRFIASVLWYTLVQMVQLSWMTAIDYQGIYILIVYAALTLCLGTQFGILSLFVRLPLTSGKVLCIASLWTLMEWVRLFFLCGFSWNPAGLALACSIFSLQAAAVWGVLGLSFWVIFTNLWLLRCLLEKKGRDWAVAIGVALVPYLFGLCHIAYHKQSKGEKGLSVALVQPGLLPCQKLCLEGQVTSFISPWEQWIRILQLLRQTHREQIDLIALPEAVVPFGARDPLFALEDVSMIARRILGEKAIVHLPPLEAPYAVQREEKWLVSNAFWVQLISNAFDAEVVAGLDDVNLALKENYNAALHFLPSSSQIGQRYAKMVLVPLAEYLPFEWCRALTKFYGITSFYTAGKEAQVMGGKILLSPSICYEETFGELMREGRQKGARLFVNLTNDNWYPASKLARQHFEHGRLRSIENGVPLVRACNAGVTAVVNSLGETEAELGETVSGVLVAAIPSYTYSTLYTHWGDSAIVAACLFALAAFLRCNYTEIG